MIRKFAGRSTLVDATFALAVLVWMASLVTMMHVGYMIAPFAIPLFIVSLRARATWRRAVIAALGIGWGGWMLWIGLA